MKIFVYIAVSFILFSCNQDLDSSSPITEHCFSRDIIVTGESNNKALEGDDLYGVQVISSPITESNWKKYAYGLFNDPSKIKINLDEDRKYTFKILKVTKGTNIINHNNDNAYDLPFLSSGSRLCSLNNEFTYSETESFSGIEYAAARIITDNGVKYFQKPYAKYYFKKLGSYVPNDNKTITIKLERIMFTMVYSINDSITEGRFLIELKGTHNIEINAGSPQVKKSYPTSVLSANYPEEINITISWIKNNQVVSKKTKQITIKRYHLYNVRILKTSTKSVNNTIIDFNIDS